MAVYQLARNSAVMKRIFAALLAFAWCSGALAAVANWSNKCTEWHGSPDNTRDPNMVWDTYSARPGICNGYDDTVYAISPCNNAKLLTTASGLKISVPVDDYVDVPLEQFNDPEDEDPEDDITQAKSVCVHIYAVVANLPAGGLLEVSYRAKGSSFARSTSSNFPWSGHDYLCVPVRGGVFEYKPTLFVPAGVAALTSQPIWQLNFIINSWCK
jgi:hypothetical protein